MARRHTDRQPSGGGGHGLASALLRKRWLLYALVVVALLVLRAVPGLWPHVRVVPHGEKRAKTLTLAGLDLAPSLIPRLAEEYRRLYPETAFRLNRGGTRHALQDLLNRKADIAFLGRPPTEEEAAVVRSVVDTTWNYPIALGGIAILVPASSTLDSLRVDELRSLICEGLLPQEGDTRRAAAATERFRLYAPDPNLGLWTALVGQLDLPDTAQASVFWCEDDRAVAEAVARDEQALGFVSTLALPPGTEEAGVRAVRLLGTAGARGVEPSDTAVAVGDYPLFHYLYIACRPDCNAPTSGFVSFLYSGRGQRLIAREGFLPARDAPREIRIVSRPIGKIG